jgi:hypothetical protein
VTVILEPNIYGKDIARQLYINNHNPYYYNNHVDELLLGDVRHEQALLRQQYAYEEHVHHRQEILQKIALEKEHHQHGGHPVAHGSHGRTHNSHGHQPGARPASGHTPAALANSISPRLGDKTLSGSQSTPGLHETGGLHLPPITGATAGGTSSSVVTPRGLLKGVLANASGSRPSSSHRQTGSASKPQNTQHLSPNQQQQQQHRRPSASGLDPTKPAADHHGGHGHHPDQPLRTSQGSIQLPQLAQAMQKEIRHNNMVAAAQNAAPTELSHIVDMSSVFRMLLEGETPTAPSGSLSPIPAGTVTLGQSSSSARSVSPLPNGRKDTSSISPTPGARTAGGSGTSAAKALAGSSGLIEKAVKSFVRANSNLDEDKLRSQFAQYNHVNEQLFQERIKQLYDVICQIVYK